VSVTVDGKADVVELAKDLAELGEVRIERDRAVVALVGERLRGTPGIPGRALSSLADINVEMISLGANEINLSIVVERGQAAEAQRRLHAAFFEA
jgi:aspartate kinase